MLNFFSSTSAALVMSAITIIFMFGFMGYVFWKMFKLSGQPQGSQDKNW